MPDLNNVVPQHHRRRFQETKGTLKTLQTKPSINSLKAKNISFVTIHGYKHASF